MSAGAVGSPGAGPEQMLPRTGGRTDVEDAPSAKKAMAEKGVSRDQVQGSGKDGRVMKEDVARAPQAPNAQPSTSQPAAKQAAAPAPAQAPRAPSNAEDARREERVRMTRLRATIARRLKEAQNTAAMLTTFNEVDMGAVMGLRAEYKDHFEKRHGVKLGFMSFFVKACVAALEEFPAVNAEIEGDEVIYSKYGGTEVRYGGEDFLVLSARDLLAVVEK